MFNEKENNRNRYLQTLPNLILIIYVYNTRICKVYSKGVGGMGDTYFNTPLMVISIICWMAFIPTA